MKRRFFNFRVRLNTALFFVAFSATITGLTYYYKVASEQVWAQMKSRVKDFGKIGVTTLSSADILFLENLDIDINAVPRALPPEPQSGARLGALSQNEKMAISRSTSFQIIMQKLRRIRYASGKKPTYDSTIAASALLDQNVQIHRIWIAGVHMHAYAPDLLRVLVADEIQEIDRNNNHRIDPEESIYHIGDVFNGHGQNSIASALKGETTVSNGYRTESLGVYISGYTPIINSRGKIIALLVIDFSAASEFDALFGLKITGYYIVVAVFLFSILAASITSRFLLKPLDAMQKAAAHFGQRDFSIRLEEDTNDEFGDLAYAMNLMAHELGEYSQNLEERIFTRTQEISGILDSLEQGILTVDSRGFIQPEHSQRALAIFGLKEIAHKKLSSLFEDKKLQASLEQYLSLFFGENVVSPQMLEQANPLTEIHYTNFLHEKKFLRFAFRPLETSTRTPLKRILVSIVDETDEFTLKAKIEASENQKRFEFDILIQWMQIPPQILENFLVQQKEIIRRGKEIIARFDNVSNATFVDFAQRVHALKGNALQLDFASLAETLHLLEEQVLAKTNAPNTEIRSCRLEISNLLNQAETLMNERDSLVSRLRAFITPDEGDKNIQRYRLMQFWRRQIEQKAITKEIPVSPHVDFEYGTEAAIHSLHNVIVQLLRNTFAHGVESPEIRQRAGKKAELTISLQSRLKHDFIEFIYTEDGRGFNQITDENEVPLESIFQKQLTPSMQTANLEAGRGLGMEYIITTIHELEAHAYVQSNAERTVLRIILLR
ncbi:MAG TPA: HAMP domain-containing protein [Turneriella sp.]|nr:HAMP domain-containing protein [Turneriella sp.]